MFDENEKLRVNFQWLVIDGGDWLINKTDSALTCFLFCHTTAVYIQQSSDIVFRCHAKYVIGPQRSEI